MRPWWKRRSKLWRYKGNGRCACDERNDSFRSLKSSHDVNRDRIANFLAVPVAVEKVRCDVNWFARL